MAVDIGPDPWALRQRYPDRSIYLILPATYEADIVPPTRDTAGTILAPTLVTGRIAQLLPGTVHVPRPLRDSLIALGAAKNDSTQEVRGEFQGGEAVGGVGGVGGRLRDAEGSPRGARGEDSRTRTPESCGSTLPHVSWLCPPLTVTCTTSFPRVYPLATSALTRSSVSWMASMTPLPSRSLVSSWSAVSNQSRRRGSGVVSSRHPDRHPRGLLLREGAVLRPPPEGAAHGARGAEDVGVPPGEVERAEPAERAAEDRGVGGAGAGAEASCSPTG